MTLPTGTVTFLFTDIEGSTRLWDNSPTEMSAALARHDALLRHTIANNRGSVFKTMGDAFCAAFAIAPEALMAAFAAQQALLTEPWPEPLAIKVRMALHTGTAELRDGDYFGPPLNSVSRLLATGHGGQTLLSQTVYDLVRDTLPADTTLLSLGEHRLKDLARAETVYQLMHPALPAEFPPLRSLNSLGLPNNLPRELTSFVGREKEIDDIKGLLPGIRLLTLTGSGGCGKTRLALQVAATVLEQYHEGVWLVDLAPLVDPALMPQSVAQALGLRAEPGKPVMQTLADYLKPKQMLLLMDNCEHLIAAAAALVETLLRTCPQVKILATSRERLHIAGERVYRVPSLSLPPLPPTDYAPMERPDSATRSRAKRRNRDAVSLNAGNLPTVTSITLDSLMRYEAVRLFLDRALAVAPDLVIADTDAPALAALCHRLDGIPLALELAAARVLSLSVEEIKDRLDTSFRLLTGGSRTALPRQQTLRALIDWSYSLLNAQEQALLCRLSAFAGGWTLEAAESVCLSSLPSDDVLDLLAALVAKSLVILDRQGDEARYRLLQTVRQYAHDRLIERGEGDMARSRHRDYYLALAEASERKLTGAQQGAWLERLETEHDNLRAALDWSINEGSISGGREDKQEEPANLSAASFALRLCGALWRFWAARGYTREGLAWCTAALEAEGAAARTATRAKALNGAGGLARVQGDYIAARIYYGEALSIAREQEDRAGIANALNGLGLVAYNQGDYAAARACHEESLDLRRAIGDGWGIALSLGNLANVVHNQGDYTAARSYHEESLTLRLKVGDRQGAALSLIYLGHVARDQGDYASAQSYYVEGLKIRQAAGDRWGIASSLESFADLAATRAHASLQEKDTGEGRTSEGGDESQSSLRRSARLWGAAQAMRERIGAPLSPVDRAKQEREMAAAREKMGDAEWQAAWSEGLSMTQEQAVAYALASPDPFFGICNAGEI